MAVCKMCDPLYNRPSLYSWGGGGGGGTGTVRVNIIVLPKNTTQWPQPGLKPGLFNPGWGTLTIRSIMSPNHYRSMLCIMLACQSFGLPCFSISIYMYMYMLFIMYALITPTQKHLNCIYLSFAKTLPIHPWRGPRSRKRKIPGRM